MVLPDSEEYPCCSFYTNMFGQLAKTTCKDCLADINEVTRSCWIRNHDSFDLAKDTRKLIKLYANYALTKYWDQAHEKHTNILAMATKLYKEKQKTIHTAKSTRISVLSRSREPTTNQPTNVQTSMLGVSPLVLNTKP